MPKSLMIEVVAHQSCKDKSVIPPQTDAKDCPRRDAACQSNEQEECHNAVDNKMGPYISVGREDDILNW